MSETFNNRVALVTGSTGGVGPAVCQAFLDAGATVVGVARSAKAGDSGRYIAVHADLTSEDGAKSAVEETLRRAKRLDILVHVMGGFAAGTSVAETPLDTWDKMMTLNLRSAFLTMRAALPPMLEAGYGRIAGVSAKASLDPMAAFGAYAVSKAGLNTLIGTIAEEGKEKGVTANAVLASIIDTPANRKAMPDAEHGKWVKPERIAQQIRWLCSEEAADVSGALLPVYGRV